MHIKKHSRKAGRKAYRKAGRKAYRSRKAGRKAYRSRKAGRKSGEKLHTIVIYGPDANRLFETTVTLDDGANPKMYTEGFHEGKWHYIISQDAVTPEVQDRLDALRDAPDDSIQYRLDALRNAPDE